MGSKRFGIPYKKTVYGVFVFNAKDLAEAKEIARTEDYMRFDEYDNDSDYEVDELNLIEY